MGFIEDELSEVRRIYENVIPGCKLISCVRSMVRAEIKRTDCKVIVACIQFPEDYPSSILLLELKSKTLPDKLLAGLTSVCEKEAKKLVGKAQVLCILKFIRNFLDENPLSCCYDEINTLKSYLKGGDELKLKQKSSSLILKVSNAAYYLHVKIIIPDEYPKFAVKFEDTSTNFPPSFFTHMVAQANEISRQCVEPPLRKLKPKDPPFQPGPSLLKSVGFLVDCVQRFPDEPCQFCKKQCFPKDPKHLVLDENSPEYVERVYCGHLFHQECLFKYMKTPPFGNKKCHTCGQKISHHKWSLSDRLAEERWAHEQARQRELAEVEDFLK